MEINLKIFFTILIVLLALAVIVINPNKIVPFRENFWRGGEKDSLRNLFYKRSGEPRKYLKHITILWFATVILVIWLLL